MKQYLKKQQRTNTVNITSLIDVVFMLVIFFMIGSSFDKTSIPVSLPASSSSSESATDSLAVTIDSGENIYVNDKPVLLEDVTETVKILLPSMKDSNAVLYSDETVQLSKVISVIDALNHGGVENVAIKTRSAE